ncbi:MAG: aspartate-alanine antiporter [Acetobacteraceae bacterium]|nr:aspartate-alanine antiporter [Acetobacteraceae bacterium]
MHILVDTLRHHPEIALFLTLAIGFWFGALKFGAFSLGTVTSTLIVGLLIGQLDIHVAPVLGTTFFIMFLFAIGYSVGPQFFPALKKEGLSQVLFTLIVAFVGLVTAYVAAKILGYNPGLAAGLLAGGMTNSGTLGVATANMNILGVSPQDASALAGLAAIAYAVTYPFGAAGTAWFLSSLAPRLLKIDLQKACAEYEAATGGNAPSADDGDTANRPVLSRTFRVENRQIAGHTASEVNAEYGATIGAFITRYRGEGRVLDADAPAAIQAGATVAIAGSPHGLLQAEKLVGPEVEDAELLSYPAETLDIVVTRKDVASRTVRSLQRDELGRFGRAIFLLGVTRHGRPVPVTPDLVIQHRDVLTVRGARSNVEALVKSLGSADRPTTKSDIAFMGAGIVIGCLIGLITFTVGGVPLSLSPEVGALLAGLVFGYLRSIYRTFGRIPKPAVWVFNNVGLNGFIAAVGLNAGPGLISGLARYGIGLFVAGIVVSLVPAVVAVALGRFVFKFEPALLFGACAGARTSTPSLGAVQEASHSAVPALGYTLPYALGRIVMAVFGTVILMIMK